MALDNEKTRITNRQAANVRANLAMSAEKLVKALQDNVDGTVDLSPSQVKSAQTLLDRVLPTMQSIDQTTHTDAPEMSPAELDAALDQQIITIAREEPERIQKLIEQAKQPLLKVV